MQVHLLGVRGSTPAPGHEFSRYGGNTSSVAIARDGAAPRLVLDAGTGLRRLGRLLEGGVFHGTILLTHLHWDHTHGLPFSPSVDNPASEVSLLLPEQGIEAEELLGRMMGPPHFPITPGQLRGQWTFGSITPGDHRIEGFDVLAREIEHKGGRTFGYRISDDTGSIAYLPDHAAAGGDDPSPGLLELVTGVDLLIHDAQHTAAEFEAVSGFGHSAIEQAVRLAERVGAARLLLFHHDPNRSDDALDAVVASLESDVDVTAAVEGDVVSVVR